MSDKGGELGEAEELGEEVMGEEVEVEDLEGGAVVIPGDERLVLLDVGRVTWRTWSSF